MVLRGLMALMAVLIMKLITGVQLTGQMIMEQALPMPCAVLVVEEIIVVWPVNLASTKPTACPTTRASPAPACCQTLSQLALAVRSASARVATTWSVAHVRRARQGFTKTSLATNPAPFAPKHSRPQSPPATVSCAALVPMHPN